MFLSFTSPFSYLYLLYQNKRLLYLFTIIFVNFFSSLVYRLTFWYKNNGIIDVVGGSFKGHIVLCGFNYTSEVQSGYPIYNLKRYADDWLYFDEVFIAEEDYKNITLSFLSIGEVNDLYLANISLIKDLGNYSYSYDTNGNIISSTLPNDGISSFKYDNNNELTKLFNPSGSNFKIEYDNIDTSKVLSGISSDGISNSIKYDTYNHPIKTNIKRVGLSNDNTNIINIRLKGTDKYITSDIYNKTLLLKEETCSIDRWHLIKEDSYYYIKNSYIPYYFTIQNNKVILTSNINNATKFTLDNHDNGSYSLYINNTNNVIAYKDNNLIIEEYSNTYINEFYLESVSNLYIETSAKYNGKILESVTDSLDNKNTYTIDSNTGLITSMTNSKGIITTYEYNSKDELTKVTSNNKSINYSYSNNLISNITLPNKEYIFTYDNFLNKKDVKVNNHTLVTNNYEDNNGNLLNTLYGNNTSISYTYDNLNRLSTLTKDKIYNFYYDNLNNLSKVIVDNTIYEYTYDLAGRLINYKEKFNTNRTDRLNKYKSIGYTYNINNNISNKVYNNNGSLHNIDYQYNNDDYITKIIYDNNDNLNVSLDTLNRIVSKNINDNIITNYTYLNNGNKTSYLIDTYSIDNDIYKYEYDSLYNITKVLLNNNVLNEYTYDLDNQLIEDNNYSTNITYKYTYDNYGNVLSKKEYLINTDTLLKEDTYNYEDTSWNDLLTKYNDTNITYDNIGNPISVGNTNYIWINGRELSNITSDTLDIKYSYDRNGYRIKKIVNNIETTYFLENSNIIFEYRSDGMLYFKRDNSNNLVGFTYKGNNYYYKKNNLEDIIGIYDNTYNLICTYEYDSYGKILSIKDINGNDITDTSNIAIINPYRYRSYYYDEETKYYYLNSRYYNPEMGRFINADNIMNLEGSLISYNLFSYCKNNPIGNTDASGRISIKSVFKTIRKYFSAGINYLKNNIGSTESTTSSSVTSHSLSVSTPIGNATVSDYTNASIQNSDNKFISFNHDISNDGFTEGVSVGKASINHSINIDNSYNQNFSINVFGLEFEAGLNIGNNFSINSHIGFSRSTITNSYSYRNTTTSNLITNGLSIDFNVNIMQATTAIIGGAMSSIGAAIEGVSSYIPMLLF